MSRPHLFLDSSALFSGVLSASGASRVLLLLAESDHIRVSISVQVVAECERALARKVPNALRDFRMAIVASKAEIESDPSPKEVKKHLDLVSHPADVAILLAAMQSEAEYFVTHNRKHFIDDAGVAERSGIRIGSPGEALGWVREKLAGERE